MAITATVIIGFQSNSTANNAARQDLTGTIVAGSPEAPFQKVNTGVFVATAADDGTVWAAIARLNVTLNRFRTDLDAYSVTMTRTPLSGNPNGDGVPVAVRSAMPSGRR